MFNPDLLNRLRPGDKMNLAFTKAKPSWLEGQQEGAGSSTPAGAGLNTGNGVTPPPSGSQTPPAPVSSPDQTAQSQMLIARMQQMGLE